MSKKSLLIEFARYNGNRSFGSVEELEDCFSNWLGASGKRLVTFGRDYFDNEFNNSVGYTIDLFEKDPDLMSYFGFDYNDLEDTKYRTGYYERKGSRRGGAKNTNYGYGNRTGTNRGNSKGSGYNSRSKREDEGYSLKGQFRSYIDGIKKAGKGSGESFSLSQFFKSPAGILIIGIVVLVLIYKLLGPTVYALITSGAIFRIICFAIGGLVSFGILKSKNMGWPIYIKALVLFAIWVVLLNYDF